MRTWSVIIKHPLIALGLALITGYILGIVLEAVLR